MTRKAKPKPKPRAKTPRAAPAPRPREISDEEGERWLQRLKQVMLSKILHSQAKVLLEREERGMPRNQDGTYNLLAVTDWLKQRGNGLYEKPPKSMAPAESGDAQTQEDYEGLREKYRALAEKHRFLKDTDALMPKIDAERRYLAIVLQLRAALLAQSEILGAQLAHQPPADVAKQLDARFRWMCQQFEDGWVNLPERAAKAIDALVLDIRPDEVPTEKSPGPPANQRGYGDQ